MNHRIIRGDCLDILPGLSAVDCIFADPPDNLGLNYEGYDDNRKDCEYIQWLKDCLVAFIDTASIVWLSYNAKQTFVIGEIVQGLLRKYKYLEAKPCIQTFTFGQHNQRDLGNCYRPLLRLRRQGTPLYPDQIRIRSWRQEHNDSRASPLGKVPGDVFDFPRVTGNSKQRRPWCPTQLHEELIKRCIELSTPEGGTVIDPLAGTGTTLRVCKQINRHCTLIEQSEEYCQLISEEHGIAIRKSINRVNIGGREILHCKCCGGKLFQTSNNWVVCENDCGKLNPASLAD